MKYISVCLLIGQAFVTLTITNYFNKNVVKLFLT